LQKKTASLAQRFYLLPSAYTWQRQCDESQHHLPLEVSLLHEVVSHNPAKKE
jgi:hypothetical protein